MNSLNTAQLKPWHLKASYARFDTASPEIDGTLEMWWVGKGQARVEISEQGKHSVYLLTGQGRLRSGDSTHLSQAMETLVRGIEQPFPPALESLVAAPDAQRYWAEAAECYVHQSEAQTGEAPKLASVPTFCIDRTGAVRVAWIRGAKVTRDDMRTFEGREVPGAVTVSFGDHIMAKAHVDELNEAPDVHVSMAADGFVPDVFTGPVRVSGGVMAGLILTHIAPIYPVSARRAHIAGSVVFTAKIGKDGRIADLNVISSPDKMLTEAAQDAVQQWRYRPYELNGVPTEVNTTITVNFTLTSHGLPF